MRTQALALLGVVERNAYLVKRYGWWELAFFVWTIANTLTVVFIADGVKATGGTLDVERQTTILLIGAVLWAYLGIVFEILTETAPIASSAQISVQRSESPAPLMIAARQPRSA